MLSRNIKLEIEDCDIEWNAPLYEIVHNLNPDSSSINNPILTFNPEEAKWSPHVQLSWRVIESGTFNRYGVRQLVSTKWNLDLLETMLIGYDDSEVVEWLRYGWPVSRPWDAPDPTLIITNHNGATQFPDEVDAYIKKEIALGAMFGPFLSIPWSKRVGINTIHSRQKKNSLRRRILLDLSWPPFDTSVNSEIPVGMYLDQPMQLKYPSVDTLANRIAAITGLALIFGFDMNRAYRQLSLDPSDYSLMGIYWKGFFFWDCNSPMGLRSASIFCQRTTNCFKFIQNKKGYWLMAYQDDLNAAEPAEIAWEAFFSLRTLLATLNIDLSEEKTIEPTTCAEILGVWFDTILKIIAVTPERVQETLCLLERWRFMRFATKKQLQSLIGKLQFMAKCVRPGRVFISRLLLRLLSIPDGCTFEINDEIKMDIKFWYEFLPLFNGESVMRSIDTAVPGVEIASDCNMKACGAQSGIEYFHAKFPEAILNETNHISQRELLTVVVSLKTWGHKIKGKKIYFHCDNEASVICVNSGRTRDPFMQRCLREIAFLAALGGYEVRMTHVSSSDNGIPDALSRWYDGAEHRRRFKRLTSGIRMKQVRLSSGHFQWSCVW